MSITLEWDISTECRIKRTREEWACAIDEILLTGQWLAFWYLLTTECYNGWTWLCPLIYRWIVVTQYTTSKVRSHSSEEKKALLVKSIDSNLVLSMVPHLGGDRMYTNYTNYDIPNSDTDVWIQCHHRVSLYEKCKQEHIHSLSNQLIDAIRSPCQ